MRFHYAVVLLLGLTAGVLADEPPCRTGKCEGDCDCGPRIRDCGCFRVAGADQCIDTSVKPRGKGPPVTIDDRVKKPAVNKKPAYKTLCLCGKTGKCVCWADECNCPECKKKATPEVAAPAAPFGIQPLGPTPTAYPVILQPLDPFPSKCTAAPSPYPGPVTSVPYVGGQPYRTVPAGFPSSASGQYGAPTYTLTGSTGGITSGCANGQCGTVQRRGLFFR